jgi:hypothetical protein
MRRLTHLVVLVAFVFSCGGPWYLFQCAAWVKMIHDFAQTVPLTEAVSMTFSGQYPCEICKAIAEKNQSANDKIFSLEKYDKNFCLSIADALARRDAAPCRHPGHRDFLQFRSEPPPTPPPRLA